MNTSIDSSNPEWKEALRLVRSAMDGGESDRAAAFDFLRTAESKRILSLAHLLQPGATPRSIQAALVPLERVDRRAKITDAEMGIRNTDTPSTSPNPIRSEKPFVVIADNLRSAFNAGGVFRTADFFGVSRIVLCGYTPGPENPQVKKTSLGADETTPFTRIPDVRDAIDSLRGDGYAIYALETAIGARSISSFVPRFPCALILGNERFGIDPDVVANADAVIEIPSLGMKNSLNVVSAFAVAAAFIRR